MDIRQLEYFLTVSRLGNITKAAEEQHIAQPSLSAALNKLEEELGVKLLRRSNKGVELTKAGIYLAERARLIVSAITETKQGLLDFKEQQEIRLGMPATIGSRLRECLLDNFTEHFPHINLNMETLGTVAILQGLEEKKIDLGYTVIDGLDESYKIRPVQQGEIYAVVAANSELCQQGTFTLQAAAKQRIFFAKKGTTYIEQRIRQELKDRGLVADKISYIEDQVGALEMVAAAKGIIFTLDPEISLIKNNRTLKAMTLQEKLCFKTGFIWRDKQTVEAKLMLDYVTKNFLRKREKEELWQKN